MLPCSLATPEDGRPTSSVVRPLFQEDGMLTLVVQLETRLKLRANPVLAVDALRCYLYGYRRAYINLQAKNTHEHAKKQTYIYICIYIQYAYIDLCTVYKKILYIEL